MLEHAEFFDWAIKGILAASFGGWAWVVKTFGDRHIVGMQDLAKKIEQISTQLTELNLRLSILEHDYQTMRERHEG